MGINLALSAPSQVALLYSLHKGEIYKKKKEEKPKILKALKKKNTNNKQLPWWRSRLRLHSSSTPTTRKPVLLHSWSKNRILPPDQALALFCLCLKAKFIVKVAQRLQQTFVIRQKSCKLRRYCEIFFFFFLVFPVLFATPSERTRPGDSSQEIAFVFPDQKKKKEENEIPEWLNDSLVGCLRCLSCLFASLMDDFELAMRQA